MPETPAEKRREAVEWLRDLERHPTPLNRHLFLVPGITDESAGCWKWITDQGSRLIPNWDAYVTVVTFDSVPAQVPMKDFIDFGAYLHDVILRVCGPSGSESAQFDVVCHSMGGLDTFAAFVPLLGRHANLGPLPKARYFITLDTPWRGVLNWDIRCKRADVKDKAWPGRPTQCAALRPDSPELSALMAERGGLAGAVEHVVCFSADRESPIEVEWSSSNLFSDRSAKSVWPGGPSYALHLVDGSCHSGIGGITWSPIAISQVLNYLLFNA